MAEIAEYVLDDGSVVRFECTSRTGAGSHQVGGRQTPARITERIGGAVGAAREVLDAARALGADSVEVKFGITLTAGLSWAVARASAESSFEVTLGWSASAASEGNAPAEPGPGERSTETATGE